MRYNVNKVEKPKRRSFLIILIVVFIATVCTLGVLYFVNNDNPMTVEEKISARLTFDASLSDNEKESINEAILKAQIPVDVSVVARASMLTSVDSSGTQVLDAYVPVTNVYSIRQGISIGELNNAEILVPSTLEPIIKQALADTIGVPIEEISNTPVDLLSLTDTQIAFVPVQQLSADTKLLTLDGEYYLDSFNSGAIFRTVQFTGSETTSFNGLKIAQLPSKETVFKANMTGVTALTREMQDTLARVGDPLYFSEKIGDFLADADLTHVSNEVSFKDECAISRTLFCSPPEFIETLKASGVDLVELTGNHNNDLGAQLNTDTINLYRSLGWGTVGGGLNSTDAALPYITDQKGTKIAFLAYNYPDSPNGGAIAGPERAGANSFNFDKIEADIAATKLNADFVQVHIQYWECYAYPDGYIEFPECDKPIGEQEAVFKRIVDLGADMVIGSSAHQPQTYEIYNGKPIYYGLGNLYFDQYYWPGTERGIVVTNYFIEGVHVQSKLTGTVFDRSFQTRVMTDAEAEFLFTRLNAAR